MTLSQANAGHVAGQVVLIVARRRENGFELPNDSRHPTSAERQPAGGDRHRAFVASGSTSNSETGRRLSMRSGPERHDDVGLALRLGRLTRLAEKNLLILRMVPIPVRSMRDRTAPEAFEMELRSRGPATVIHGMISWKKGI
jgi:hypothetical protein